MRKTRVKRKKDFEKGLNAIDDALKEIEKIRTAKLLLTAYYREGKNWDKAEKVCRMIMKTEKSLRKKRGSKHG